MPVQGDNRLDAPKKWVFWTKIVILGILAIILGWDVIVANNPWRADSISEVTLWANLRSFTTPLFLGYVAGHLTWPGSKRNPVWVVFLFSAILLAIALTFDILTWTNVVSWSWIGFVRSWPVITFLPAYVLGRFCWPQVRG